MKKIYSIVIFLICIQIVHAQQSYLNEWIDYHKTYYKFNIGPFGYDAILNPIRNGVVRIPQSALAGLQLANTPSEQFQLWRDGEEIPLYISKPSGILTSSDFIEFWGEIAGGKVDKGLYADSSFQLTDVTCLETDTASYFLTANPTGVNKRFVTTPNNVLGATLPAEKNFQYMLSRHFRGYVSNGFGIFLEQNLYLSSYASGEGLGSRALTPGSSILHSFTGMYADTNGAPMTFKIAATGSAANERSVKVLLNNDSLVQFPMDYFQMEKYTMPGISAKRIKGDAANILVQDIADAGDDDIRLGRIDLQYPRLFNFGGATTFEFYLDAEDQGRYLKIANFNKGSADAVLFDFTNGKRYVGVPGTGDTVQFVLQPSVAQYHLLLLRSDGSTALKISTIKERPFTNYADIANQGDYLIITNPLLLGGTTDNYVQQYSDYRRSDTGGNFKTRIIDIHDLEDQFSYGVKMHPLSIKGFLRYARDHWAQPPAYVFLVGKGVTYNSYRTTLSTDPLTNQLNLVPVFGNPGSDNLLSSADYDPVPATPIGRLSAVSPAEVGIYLDKIKQYEYAQRHALSEDFTDKSWMKKVIQLAGANDVSLEPLIDAFQEKYRGIIADTLFGGDVRTYSKTSSNGAEYGKAVQEFTNEFNTGSAMVEYLGHSSSTSIDFSLDNPANYSNTGKYPMFIVNGCLAGNIFDFDVNRLNARSTISEKFVLEPQKGAIGYLSSSSYGVLNYLDIFTEQFYRAISTTEYDQGFGNVVKEGIVQALNYTGISDFYGRMHAEQFTYHGDPALKMNSFSGPDYYVDSTEMTISPAYLTVASDSFTVKLKLRNLGKAITDSVHFTLTRIFPNGDSSIIYSSNLAALNNVDSFSFKLPIVSNRDKGTTTINASLDEKNLITEINENNNIGSVKIKISAADLLPVSPYNYSIINSNTINLIASTSYALDSLTQYVVEMDTTSLFNSPLKITKLQVGAGGIVEFTNMPLSLDNTVYFWRVSEDSADKHWNTFSFIYRSAGNTGFEQAHFFQHTNSTFNNMLPDSSSRSYGFGAAINNLFVLHSIFPTSGNEDNHFSIALNGVIITWSACLGTSVIFNVFDPRTLNPILNSTRPYNAGAICDPMRKYNFEYKTDTKETRKNAMDFMDNYVQNGYYVVVRKIYDIGNNDWAPTVWAADTAFYGHNNSLYHRLKDLGTQIDSFTYPRTFIFIYKKNDTATYKTVSVLSKGLYDRISISQNYPVIDTIGSITSPAFGPGKAWNKVKWYGNNINENNRTELDVIAIDKAGKDSVFYTIGKDEHELDISALNAVDYPFVKLRMRSSDSLTVTPYQLQDWSVEFTPVPEGAIATNLGVEIPEAVTFNHDVSAVFDTLKGYIIFQNISNAAFSPIKVNLTLYDEANVAHTFIIPRTKALNPGDTVMIPFLLNVNTLPEGIYNLYIDVNPDNDQAEQYHYNNFLYKYITINRDFVLASHKFDLSAKAVYKTVQLQWTVLNEANVAAYEVQFSKDGRSFEPIGTVAPSLTDNPSKQYGFIHTSPVDGRNYYRIKMTDKNGAVSFTPIRYVVMQFDAILVYPNPFNEQLNIILKESNNKVQITLSDISGRQLLVKTCVNSITLNIKNLAAGMYILEVNNGVAIQSFKVFKQ